MPVWAGGGERGRAAQLGEPWGTDLLVKAMRVEDDDDPTPVPSVREQFRRWADAAGKGARLKTVRMLGHDGCYVLCAAAAAA